MTLDYVSSKMWYILYSVDSAVQRPSLQFILRIRLYHDGTRREAKQHLNIPNTISGAKKMIQTVKIQIYLLLQVINLAFFKKKKKK